MTLSPASAYRVLREAGLIRSWAKPIRKKGTGFLQLWHHWHIDVNVAAMFYYFYGIGDGCSQLTVHLEIQEAIEEPDAEIVLQRAQ